MARKTKYFTIDGEGRDNGKMFLLTEMPALQAESWSMRLILAMIKGGIELPEGFEHMGMAGVAQVGIKALGGLEWEVAEPLLNEMMTCVKIVPTPDKPDVVRKLIADDIEEVQTLLKIRMEIFRLHTDFFAAAKA